MGWKLYKLLGLQKEENDDKITLLTGNGRPVTFNKIKPQWSEQNESVIYEKAANTVRDNVVYKAARNITVNSDREY